MDWLEEKIDGFRRDRLNCSQIMMALSLELRDLENPELLKAMSGLGGGLHVRHVCGTLTGGCCLLASYDDSERDMHTASLFLPGKEIIRSYVQWFEREFGSLLCEDLTGGDMTKMATVCPVLLKQSFEKCIALLQESGINPEI